MHARIAQVLEERFPEMAEAQPELLAQHWAHAGYAKQAIGYWRKAAQQAIARSAMQEAASHARTALQLIPALPEEHARWEQELDLQVALGTALIAVKGYTAPETGEVYERARVLLRAARRHTETYPSDQWAMRLPPNASRIDPGPKS